MYSDFHDRGINLARELPRLGGPESDYTPRLLLSLIENFGEGTAFFASQTGVPEMRHWTMLHDLLIALHNTELTHFLINIKQEDRKKFEYMKSPLAQYFEQQSKKNNQRRGVKILLGDDGNGPKFDQLPSGLIEEHV